MSVGDQTERLRCDEPDCGSGPQFLVAFGLTADGPVYHYTCLHGHSIASGFRSPPHHLGADGGADHAGPRSFP
jgi:hypothetical protein